MKKRIIVVGDTHGAPGWQTLVNEPYDKFIFMGDYFDSFHFSIAQQLRNFRKILQFRNANPDKVVLLFGNHDFHYLDECESGYSGYQHLNAKDISDILYSGTFKICHIEDGYLFSHAGITKTWAKNNNVDLSQVAVSVNELFEKDKKPFDFNRLGRNPYGDDICQGALWVRPNSLREDMIDGYVQVVGHTREDQPIITKNIIQVDCIEPFGWYLVIEDGIPKATRLMKYE